MIGRDSPYADKTAYPANMIAGGNKTWFPSRPRPFGKYLTVSTLGSLFPGQKHPC
ncbi:MAG: AAA family ATPase [Deltaproteobacteria bacterium]|nr:AAA family ATPase [Deltaproteobacteria bacterium]